MRITLLDETENTVLSVSYVVDVEFRRYDVRAVAIRTVTRIVSFAASSRGRVNESFFSWLLQRPTAKELLKFQFIRKAKKNSYLIDLIDRYKKWKSQRSEESETESENSDSWVIQTRIDWTLLWEDTVTVTTGRRWCIASRTSVGDIYRWIFTRKSFNVSKVQGKIEKERYPIWNDWEFWKKSSKSLSFLIRNNSLLQFSFV